MARIKQLSKRGFTLVELMIVVVIIGILAALAIYGVQKYVSNSKSAEARMSVGRMSKDASARYEAETMSGALIPLGSSAGSARMLCMSALNTVPLNAPLEGEKYQPEVSEWEDPAAPQEGWPCLSFSVIQPIYFRYVYVSDQPDTVTPSGNGIGFTAYAEAEMGGTFKHIYQNGKVDTDGAGNDQLVVAPSLCEKDDPASAMPAANTAVKYDDCTN